MKALTARYLLDKFRYHQDTMLMNAPTGSVDLAINWACEAADGAWGPLTRKEIIKDFAELIEVEKNEEKDTWEGV